MDRLNCWEFTRCGLQEQNPGQETDGSCPAFMERRLHGVHGGKNGGRACWVVLGTRCQGATQSDMKEKYKACGECEFYRVVKKQERGKLELTLNLLGRLEDQT